MHKLGPFQPVSLEEYLKIRNEQPLPQKESPQTTSYGKVDQAIRNMPEGTSLFANLDLGFFGSHGYSNPESPHTSIISNPSVFDRKPTLKKEDNSAFQGFWASTWNSFDFSTETSGSTLANEEKRAVAAPTELDDNFWTTRWDFTPHKAETTIKPQISVDTNKESSIPTAAAAVTAAATTTGMSLPSIWTIGKIFAAAALLLGLHKAYQMLNTSVVVVPEKKDEKKTPAEKTVSTL